MCSKGVRPLRVVVGVKEGLEVGAQVLVAIVVVAPHGGVF
jgi:hypothetical protein